MCLFCIVQALFDSSLWFCDTDMQMDEFTVSILFSLASYRFVCMLCIFCYDYKLLDMFQVCPCY